MTPELWTCDQYDAEAQRLYEDGDYDAALKLLREGLSLYPSSSDLLVSVGYVRLAREEYAWARTTFERALLFEPDQEEALAGLGEALLKLGERARALLLFERVLGLGFDRDADLMVCVGRMLFREGLHERAERFFRLAVSADPSCAEAALELGYTLYRTGDRAEALRWGGRATDLDPLNHDARAFVGNLLYEREEYREALSALITIPPDELWDPVAVWRVVELLRRLSGLQADSEEIRPYMERLELLSAEPTPEDRILAEIETAGDERVAAGRGQLDLFGWVPPPIKVGERGEFHRVRAADGRVFEGDWVAIVRAMRDRSTDPSATLREFMRDEAQRLHAVTGVAISWEDPRAFIEDVARAGALRIES